MKDDAVLFVNAANDAADLRSHDARERLGLRRDDVHVELAGAERRGDFQADEARADDDHGCGGRGPRDDRPAVAEAAEVVHLRLRGARNVDLHRIGAGGNQQRIEPVRLAALELDDALLEIERRRARLKHEVDLLVRVELGRAQRNPVFLGRARQVVLRQIRTIAWRRVVRAEHRDRSVVALPPKHVRGRETSRAAAKNEDGFRRTRGGRARWRCRLRKLRADVDRVALAIDAPARDRIERRRPQRVARAQAEARVMPRTADGVADDEPVGERAVVVRAVRADGEDLLAPPHQNHVVVADSCRRRSAVRQVC